MSIRISFLAQLITSHHSFCCLNSIQERQIVLHCVVFLILHKISQTQNKLPSHFSFCFQLLFPLNYADECFHLEFSLCRRQFEIARHITFGYCPAVKETTTQPIEMSHSTVVSLSYCLFVDQCIFAFTMFVILSLQLVCFKNQFKGPQNCKFYATFHENVTNRARKF